MEICGHCHNVLPKTVDRCTVCGTSRVDPDAADVRRRADGDLPSHAPGWAAPSVPDSGISPDDFLRELAGDDPTAPAVPTNSPTPPSPALPPRAIPPTPAPGALAGYLGTNVDRRPQSADAAEPADWTAPPPLDLTAQDGPDNARFDQHLSTATRVAADGVAARTTRLDGTVKLGPTASHRALTLGAPILAGLLLFVGTFGSYNVQTSVAEEVEATEETTVLDLSPAQESSSAVVRLDLDGCGIIDQTTGFLFASNTVLVPKSNVDTDSRPSIFTADGAVWPGQTQGWSLNRNLAIVRPEERIPGGLEWGVSSRVRQGDAVSVLAITEPGIAEPVVATIAVANTRNGRNTSFELDIDAAEGSVVLNAEGFVIGVIDRQNLVHASDDVAPAISRLVLANERPREICPTPPTTAPPTTLLPDVDETTTDDTEDTTPDE